MKNLVKAILAVMAEVENIDKSMDVGSGNNSYKGVSDKDVKLTVGKAMQKHGLVMMPIEVNPNVKVERWEEENYYNGQKQGVKVKQSVFTEVNTKYLLLHESGESIEISGYGHGIDSQDKSAGKATTYALKNALLYTFLVPTGAIDDTDKTHSEDINTPSSQSSKTATPIGIAPTLVKVIENAKDLDVLNTIWNNNTNLHENVSFIKVISMKRASFTNTLKDLTALFNSVGVLHVDPEFVSFFTDRKNAISNTQNQQTA